MTRSDLITSNADKPVSEPQVYLSRGDVAEIFSVSPNTNPPWSSSGTLPVVHSPGGHRRYEKRIIISLVKSQIHEQELERKLNQKEEAARVNRIVLDIPKLYGDHHVAPIQRLLANRQGIQNVWITPANRQVHVDFSPDRVDEAQIRSWWVDVDYPPADTPVPAPARPINVLAWDHTAFRTTQMSSCCNGVLPSVIAVNGTPWDVRCSRSRANFATNSASVSPVNSVINTQLG